MRNPIRAALAIFSSARSDHGSTGAEHDFLSQLRSQARRITEQGLDAFATKAPAVIPPNTVPAIDALARLFLLLLLQAMRDDASSITMGVDDEQTVFAYVIDDQERQLIPPAPAHADALVARLTDAAAMDDTDVTGTLSLDLLDASHTLTIRRTAPGSKVITITGLQTS